MAAPSKLPAEFADLEPYLDWDLATEPERYAKRLASTMTEMQAFYDVAFPRLEDVIAYCDKFPLDDLPEEAKTLMHIMQSLVMVSFPIEAWKQPRVPDSGAAWVGLSRAPGLEEVLTLKAPGLRDIDAGGIVRRGILRLEEDGIVGVGECPEGT